MGDQHCQNVKCLMVMYCDNKGLCHRFSLAGKFCVVYVLADSVYIYRWLHLLCGQ